MIPKNHYLRKKFIFHEFSKFSQPIFPITLIVGSLRKESTTLRFPFPRAVIFTKRVEIIGARWIEKGLEEF